MCLNLFFPFCSDGYAWMPLLLKVLDLPPGEVTAEFEKVFEREENTNFDFCLEYKEGRKVFFETKLSETGFARPRMSLWEEKYSQKLETYYRTPLVGIVDAKWLQRDRFMKHYQVLRNISYLGRYLDSKLFFIYPKANETLRRDEAAILEIAALNLSDRVRIVYLENLIEDLLKCASHASERLHTHYVDFKQKYMV